MTENSVVKKVPAVAKVFGWISLVVSCLGTLGIVLLLIVTVMPSYNGPSVQIQSEDAAKLVVFFFGIIIGFMVPPIGGVTGLVSLIIMLAKRTFKMIWLPITSMAISFFAFIGTILAMVVMIESF